MRASGQASLFGGDEEHGVAIFDLPNIAELAQEQLLAWERELIGFYLSAHPLGHMERVLRSRVSTFIPLLSDEWAGQQVTLGGRVVEARRIITRKNTTMMIVQFEDLQGAIEVTVFPRLYAEASELLVEEARLFITGKIEMRDEEVRFTAERIEKIEEVAGEEVRSIPHHLRVFMPRNSKVSHDLARAEEVLTILEGSAQDGRDTFDLLVQLGEGQDDVVVLTPTNNRVRYTPDLHLKLEDRLGTGTVRVGEEK
jgi:DNA polymerase III subunit alpha